MSTFRDLENLMQHFLEIGPPGCAVAVTKGEGTLFEHYCGWADAEKTQKLGPEHLYRLYSMTKVIACVCGLIQFERGKFLLDDPISEYLPEYKDMMVQVQRPDGGWDLVPSKQPILMKHAFSMGVGQLARDGSPCDLEKQRIRASLGGFKTCNQYDHLTETRAFAKIPMLWEPGTHWQYGQGLELMTAVVEVTSGMKLGDFMKKEIFEPLGMTETGYRITDDMRPRLVDGVKREADGTLTRHSRDFLEDRLTEPDAIYECAATGLISSLRDYSKFAKMLACGGKLGDVQIVGRKSLNLMRQNQLNETQLSEFRSSYLSGYGYGLGVRTMMDLAQGGSNGSLGEYGWSGMMGTWVSIDPEEEVSITYMHQIFPNMEQYTHHRLRAVINGIIR